MKNKTHARSTRESQAAEVEEALDALILQAIELNASDIHFEATQEGGRIRFRLDGALKVRQTVERPLFEAMVQRLKVMGSLNVEESQVPQYGKIQLNASDRPVALRVSTLPTFHGESAEVRILDSAGVNVEIKNLQLTEKQLNALERWQASRWGGIIFSGPVGSGKTTSMYACLNKLNDESAKIHTLEDPIDFPIPGFEQTRVSPRHGLTFATGLRAILRMDPDVIMVGEIRDLETASMIFQAILTGHLVFSTLHTESAVEVLTRFIDIGVPPFLLKSGLKGIVNQRLVRRLCDHCKVEASIDPERASRLNLPAGTYYQAKGCERCFETGYCGRLPIYEFFELSNATSRLLLENASAQEIHAQAVKEGMSSLWDDGVTKTLAGKTSIDELLRVLGDPRL